ncbi:hypothetical protein AVEN_11623-1 [Araneus ventricosus]|uniref:Uncharacterized protein n=1 Tax=Araneus ventricosus TaxID=182803 RepID=A0A4Y2TEI7_ARAVE|nr:hypothetical protein AVEN_11623-1 [Araneus ventricosus]
MPSLMQAESEHCLVYVPVRTSNQRLKNSSLRLIMSDSSHAYGDGRTVARVPEEEFSISVYKGILMKKFKLNAEGLSLRNSFSKRTPRRVGKIFS